MKVFIPYLRTLPYPSNKNSLETLKIFSAIFSVTISLHFVHIFIFVFFSDISPSSFLYETLSHYFENLERLVNKNSPNTFQIVSIIFSTMLSLHFVNIFIFDFLSETSSSHFHYEGCCSIFWESYISNEEIFTTCIPKNVALSFPRWFIFILYEIFFLAFFYFHVQSFLFMVFCTGHIVIQEHETNQSRPNFFFCNDFSF